MAQLPTSTQVVICGAGPVGLAAAVELGRRGISCLVVEPRASVSRSRPRCKTINVRTMEHLRRWGIAERLRAAAPLSPSWSQDIVFCTSLTGRELARFTGVLGLSADPERGQQAPQFVLEEVLREAVAELPTCTLALGPRVVGLNQTDAAVRVTVDERIEVEAQYVIGCDGSRSTLREAIGARYVGDVALRPNFGTVIRAPDLWRHVAHGRALHYWILNDRAPGSLGPLDGDAVWWANFLDIDRDRGGREIDGLITAAIGREVPFDVLSTDPWTAHMQIADVTRRGRVFLAGDAAHLNPPWGGHGMNTGVGDAVDLGWKLGAVLEGWGGPALLDSYELERRPVAMRVIAEAEANMNVLSSDLLSERVDDAYIQRAKRREFHSLDLVLGLGYEDSTIIVRGANGGGLRARPGFRLPHAWIAPGQSLLDRVGPGLTLLHGNGEERAAVAFEAACRRRGVPSTLVDVTALRAAGRCGPELVVVRPDQHVAWAGDGVPDSFEEVVDVVRGAAR